MSLHRRTRIRIQAFVAAVLWILGGVTDLSASRPCPFHGHGAAHEAAEMEHLADHPAAHGEHADAHGDHAATTDHASHGSSSVEAPTAISSGLPLLVDPATAGHGGCDCEVLCCGPSAVSGPEVTIEAAPSTTPVRREVPVPEATEARAPPYLLPFFQPPPHAPPSS